jgi:hypothetical protein
MNLQVTFREGIDLQALEYIKNRRGHMDKLGIHMTLIDTRVVGIFVMV